jgi:hypothetical protein
MVINKWHGHQYYFYLYQPYLLIFIVWELLRLEVLHLTCVWIVYSDLNSSYEVSFGLYIIWIEVMRCHLCIARVCECMELNFVCLGEVFHMYREVWSIHTWYGMIWIHDRFDKFMLGCHFRRFEHVKLCWYFRSSIRP